MIPAAPSSTPLRFPSAPATAALATASTDTAAKPGGPGGRVSPGGPPARIAGRRTSDFSAPKSAAIAADFGAEKSLVLRPAILAGGPPGETRPPGPPGFAAVSVDAVASAAVAGALGKRSGVLDGAAGINAAA